MAAVRTALTNYLKLAIDQDWPMMAAEKGSPEVTQALDGLYAAALRWDEGEARQTAALAEIFKQLDAMTEARRSRLHLATGVVPPVIWLLLFSGAVLTVVFTFFFGTTNLRAQVLMTGILSALTFMALFAIVQIDHPFTGPARVSNEALKNVLEDFARQG
jgi:hypothetical protein